MLCEISVKVEGDTFIKNPYQMDFEPYRIYVKSNNERIVQELVIQKKIYDYQDYLPKFIFNKDKPHKIIIPKCPHFEDLVQIAQHIESFGAYWFEIKKIYWETPKRNWIPENDDEKKELYIQNIEFDREYPKDLKEMHPDVLKQIVKHREKFKYLVIPLSFYREGLNEYKSFRYINAIYNFYFFLEDLYGGGKTKNYLVEKNFKKSEHMKYAINETLKQFETAFEPKLLNGLRQLLDEENCNYNFEGITELIVKIRGTLHHFSQKSTKKTGNPFNQQDFHIPALLLMSICIFLYVKLGSGEKPD